MSKKVIYRGIKYNISGIVQNGKKYNELCILGTKIPFNNKPNTPDFPEINEQIFISGIKVTDNMTLYVNPGTVFDITTNDINYQVITNKDILSLDIDNFYQINTNINNTSILLKIQTNNNIYNVIFILEDITVTATIQ